MIKSTDLYKNTGAIHTDPENDKYLYELQKKRNGEMICHLEQEENVTDQLSAGPQQRID